MRLKKNQTYLRNMYNAFHRIINFCRDFRSSLVYHLLQVGPAVRSDEVVQSIVQSSLENLQGCLCLWSLPFHRLNKPCLLNKAPTLCLQPWPLSWPSTHLTLALAISSVYCACVCTRRADFNMLMWSNRQCWAEGKNPQVPGSAPVDAALDAAGHSCCPGSMLAPAQLITLEVPRAFPPELLSSSSVCIIARVYSFPTAWLVLVNFMKFLLAHTFSL